MNNKPFQKIVPHLWFDTQAVEAAQLYCSLFPHSRIYYTPTVPGQGDMPDSTIVSFCINNYELQAISGGPMFSINPSISLMVNFDPATDSEAEQRIDTVWEGLSDGGTIMMPLQEYPFSKRFGWVQDKFGMTWQLILTDPSGDPRPPIIPFLLFTQTQCGNAEAATDYYMSLFDNSIRGQLRRYGDSQPPEQPHHINFTDFQLAGQWFGAIESGGPHEFVFNEAVSLIVNCNTQQEIDRLWEQLAPSPDAGQCGWIQDRYGVWWQIVPTEFESLLTNGTTQQIERMMAALMPMKKLDIAALKAAYHSA